jgi:hypothetical protein
MKLETADRVNGGFAEDDLLGPSDADPEVSGVLPRTRCKSVPDVVARATQLGADRALGLPGYHEKDRVAALIRVQFGRLDQWSQDARGQTTLPGKIAVHALEVGQTRHRQAE